MMTKQQVLEIIATDNGAEKLLKQADEAFSPAFELLCEGNGSVLGFMARAVKKKQYRDFVNENIGQTREILYDLLNSDKPKVRKNMARLLGALGVHEDDSALINALECETQAFVIPSIILALGALSTIRAYHALKSYDIPECEQKHKKEIESALETAISSMTQVGVHTFKGLDREYEVVVRGADYLAQSVAEELKELGYKPYGVFFDTCHVTTNNLEGIYTARTMRETLLPLAIDVPFKPEDIARAAKKHFSRILKAVHTGEGLFGYRIEIKGECDRGTFAKTIAKSLNDGFIVNNTSSYEAELRVEQQENGNANVFVRLITVPDERFSYRKGTVPASMLPSTAAAILRYAKQYLKEDGRVLDPCCGSGTFLFEREKFMKCHAVGCDISDKAIAIARENALCGKSKAKFVANDLSRFVADRKFDEVISNLPFGNRVGTHKDNEKLYETLLNKLPEWLTDNGVAILYTMEFTLLKRLVRENKRLKLVSQAKTGAGGLMPGIFIIKINA